MGRQYAGILGFLAFTALILRGLAQASALEATILSASAASFVLAAVGFLIGSLADFLVRDSVRLQFQSAVADWESQQKANSAGKN